MTHFIGMDFNSLYPSAFSSASHDFIKYTGGKMYMPGKITAFYDCVEKPELKKIAREIINRKDTLFIAEVKGHIDRNHLNEFINFLPIFRNIDITNDELTLGPYMVNYMKENGMKIGNTERKLTQLADSYDYMSFSSYYLWYLMDRFHFVIDDIKTLIVFNKHDKFNAFVNDFSVQRRKYLADRNPKENFFKISLNGSYGYDAMNTENYSKSFVQSAAKASCSKLSDNFKNIRKLADDVFQVDMNSDTFKCNTCIHQAYFTLDNAKYWYLVFVYEFMHKCMDMNRIHFIHGDTDAFYWAVAGKMDDELGNKQGFKHVVTDKEFYDQNVFKFLPHHAFCFDESYRPKFETKMEAMAHEKKLLGLAIEKQGDNLIALGPKCYTAWDN
jgi:hypothetical protein